MNRFDLRTRILSGCLFAFGCTTLSAQVNLGAVDLAGSVTASVTVTLPSKATLGNVSVRAQGIENLDFTSAGGGTCFIASTYTAGTSCSVAVTFKPTLAGSRYGAVVLLDTSQNVVATAYIHGTGIGSQLNFSPGKESTINVQGLNGPNGLALDSNNNLYIADWGNNRILKLIPSGTSYSQSTIATGFTNVAGIAVDGGGNVYASDWGGGRVVKETWSGSTYTESVVAAGLSLPNGVAVDAEGNLYVAEVGRLRVLKETLSNGSYTQSDILDCGTIAYTCPSSVAVDSNGTLFVSSFDNSQLIKLTPSGGSYTQSTIGSGLDWACNVVIDGRGNLYIADSTKNRIVKETLSGNGYIQSTVPTGSISSPWGVAVDQNGNIYISDTYNNRVLKENLIDPPQLSFAVPTISTSSGAQSVFLLNNGNAPLEFPVPATGTNPAVSQYFSLASTQPSDCPLIDWNAPKSGKLAAGKTCELSISYAPTVGAPDTSAGTLILTDTNLNAKAAPYATQTIALSGVNLNLQPSKTILSTSVSIAHIGERIALTASVVQPQGSPFASGSMTIASENGSRSVHPGGTSIWNLIAGGFPPVGHHTFTASYSGDLYRQASTSDPVSVTVTADPGPPANLAFFQGDVSAVYGSAPKYSIGLKVTDNWGNPVPGTIVTFSGAGLTFDAGTQTTDAQGNAYIHVFVTQVGLLTVSASTTGVAQIATTTVTGIPAPLKIWIRNVWRYYGAANPELSAKLSGLVGSDTVIVSEQTSATQSSPIGDYPITTSISGPDASKYITTIVPASVNVRKARLNVFATSYRSTYGATPPQPTAFDFQGFVNGENASVISGTPALSSSVTATTPPGYYPIHVGPGTLTAANYYFVPFMQHGSIAVAKAPLTVTPDHITMPRGGPIPALTYSLSGFINGDLAVTSVIGAPNLKTYVTSHTKPGDYPIYISTGTLASTKYHITATAGVLTVLP